MRLERGSSRAALVGEKYTLKVPCPRWENLQETFMFANSYCKNRNWLRLYELLITCDESVYWSLRDTLFRGWLENLREAAISKEMGDVVVPTRFSLFGVLNVMDSAKVLGEGGEPDFIARSFREKLGSGLGLYDHTFDNPGNFGVHDGKVKFLDYGEKRLVGVLRKHRDGCREALDNVTTVVLDKGLTDC